MKRLVLAAVAAVVLVLLVSGLALADGGPHGGYTPTTDACAGCHRAHTAAAAKLLIDTEANLCTSCHGNGSSGADTNVLDGIYDDLEGNPPPGGVEGILNRGLKGGGFLNTAMSTDFVGAGGAATSKHTYDGVLTGTAWGNGAIDSGPGMTINPNLSCASCHDPHGNGNYRILRPIPTGSGTAAAVPVADVTPKLYTVSDATGIYFGEGYNPADKHDDVRPEYGELSGWSAQCHTRYMAGPNSATTDSGDAIFAYRHSTNGAGGCSKCHVLGGIPALKPGITYGPLFQHDMQCMTCHVAHGTSALVAGVAASVPYPDGSTVSGNDRSSLLRVDGRGTCQACHEKP